MNRRLWGLAILLWGWPLARRVAFAIWYLLLMIPWPYVLHDSLAFPLRLHNAHEHDTHAEYLLPVFLELTNVHQNRTAILNPEAGSGQFFGLVFRNPAVVLHRSHQILLV